MYCLIVFPFFSLSPVLDEFKRSDQYLSCYIETHTDDPQQFCLPMDLTLREEYSMKLTAVVSHNNYYSQFYNPSCELVQ
jgi:transposase